MKPKESLLLSVLNIALTTSIVRGPRSYDSLLTNNEAVVLLSLLRDVSFCLGWGEGEKPQRHRLVVVFVCVLVGEKGW